MCEDPCGWGDSFEEGDGTVLEAGTALQAVRTPEALQACPTQGLPLDQREVTG